MPPRLALTLALACAAVPTAAHAGAGDAALAELTRNETHPRRGPLVSLHAGYHGDVAGMLELRVGYGTGSFTESLLFPTMRLWRASVAARGAYGRTDTLALSLLGGRSVVSLLGFSLEGGVDARVLGGGDANLGPLVSGALRVGRLGLHVNGWTHVLEEELDWGFSVGLGVNLFDYAGATDVAKARIRRRAGF
jgi:hypothetical protein